MVELVATCYCFVIIKRTCQKHEQISGISLQADAFRRLNASKCSINTLNALLDNKAKILPNKN